MKAIQIICTFECQDTNIQLELQGNKLQGFELHLCENNAGPYKNVLNLQNFHEFVVGINYVENDVLSCFKDLNIS